MPAREWIIAEELLDDPRGLAEVIRETIKTDPHARFFVKPKGLKPSEFDPHAK